MSYLAKRYSVPMRSMSSEGVCASQASFASLLKALPPNRSSTASGRPSGLFDGKASSRVRCFSDHDFLTCMRSTEIVKDLTRLSAGIALDGKASRRVRYLGTKASAHVC